MMVNILYEEIMPSKPRRDGLTGADVCKNFSRAVVVRELARVAVDDSEVIKLQPFPRPLQIRNSEPENWRSEELPTQCEREEG